MIAKDPAINSYRYSMHIQQQRSVDKIMKAICAVHQNHYSGNKDEIILTKILPHSITNNSKLIMRSFSADHSIFYFSIFLETASKQKAQLLDKKDNDPIPRK